MMMPTNRKTFQSFMRRDRSIPRDERTPSNTLIISFLFLHKYLSENLKNHLMKTYKIPLSNIYQNKDELDNIRKESLDELGYFINSYNLFFEKFFENENINFWREFIYDSINAMEFDDESFAKDCTGEVLQALDEELYDYKKNVIISDYIRHIGRFNVADSEFSYQLVFDTFIYLRNIYKNKTPQYISEILANVVMSQKNTAQDVYDPFLGNASVLMTLSEEFKMGKIYGKEEIPLCCTVNLMKSLIYGFKPSQVKYFKESALNSMFVEGTGFDVIVSNIPNRKFYSNQRLEHSKNAPDKSLELKNEILSKFEKNELKADKKLLDALDLFIDEVKAVDTPQTIEFEGEYELLNESEFLFIINMLNSLKNDGLMVISISQNFLFKRSLTLLRKFLTYENNYIDAIISIPEGLGRSIRPEVVIVFRKDKTTDDIIFIDVSKDYTTNKAKNTVQGLFRRNLVLSDECMDKIIDIYNNREKIEKVSEVVSLKQLEKNDFNLSMSRYVDTFEGEFVKINDLVNEKKELTAKIKSLNEKIGAMLDELNIKL